MNISSHAADNPTAGWTAYAASKAAVEQLTRSLALEIEGTGVTVCAFRPGSIETALQERIRRASPEDYPRVEEHRARKRAGLVGDPKDRARLIAYLVSEPARRNGQVLEADEALERDAAEALSLD